MLNSNFISYIIIFQTEHFLEKLLTTERVKAIKSLSKRLSLESDDAYPLGEYEMDHELQM